MPYGQCGYEHASHGLSRAAEIAFVLFTFLHGGRALDTQTATIQSAYQRLLNHPWLRTATAGQTSNLQSVRKWSLQTSRIISLDQFRGYAMAGMLLNTISRPVQTRRTAKKESISRHY